MTQIPFSDEECIAPFRFVDEDAAAGTAEARAQILPTRGSALAAGYDLHAAHPLVLKAGTHDLVRTGIALALPKGTEGQVRPRSGLARKHGVTVLNAPGTIDADYRGEIGVLLINHGKKDFHIERGMRIAQLVVAPVLSVVFAEESLGETERGQGGFGSSGV